MPGSPKWPLSIRFPTQNSVYASPLTHKRYMPRPSHSSRFHHPKIIGWRVQIIKILIMYFLHSPITSSSSGPHPMKIEIRHNNVWTPPINTYWFASNHEPGLRQTGTIHSKVEMQNTQQLFRGAISPRRYKEGSLIDLLNYSRQYVYNYLSSFKFNF